MKKVHIVALHLAFGGIEKAICQMANLFAERYEVEIISVYRMPDAPAFPLDKRVKIRYLLSDTPNREEWRAALSNRDLSAFARESLRSVRILREKKRAVIEAIRNIDGGVVITTRPEDNVLLSRYGKKGVFKIAQLHQDHGFDPKLVRSFQRDYGGIDVFALLTPGLRDEAAELLHGHNDHTKPVYIPNFLEHYPDNTEKYPREKTVLSVGRLHAVKRFDLLIRLFASIHGQYPDWQLRIVGDGEQLGGLRTLIRDLNAEDYVNLTGRKDAAAVEEEMLHASVFAMSSRSEGFPFVMLEAESCALPLLAFDVRVGPGFVIEDGKNGFLVPEGDERGFCEKLSVLMEDGEQRQKMSGAAKRHASAFSREAVGELWYSLIGD